MKKRNALKNIGEMGFTIVEVIMAGSVGMLLIGGFMSAISAMGTIQQKVAISGDSVAFESMLTENLKSGDTCTLALKNKNIMSVGQISFSTMIDGTTKTIAQDNEPLPNLRISSVELVRNTALAPIEVMTGTGPKREQFAVVKVEWTKSVNGRVEQTPPSKFPVKVLTDVSGNIESCNAGLDESRVCAESGGKLVAGVCEPLNHCELGGSYSDADASKGGYPNELTGAKNCPAGFNPVRSGTTTFSRSTSKTFIVIEYYATYSCVRCGTAVTLLPNAAFTQGFSVNNPLTGSIQTGDGYVTGQDGLVTTAHSTSGGGGTGGGGTGGGGGGGTGGGRGGGGCFVAGTQIRLADGSSKAIEEIALGDRVLAYDEETGAAYNASITQTLHHPAAAQKLHSLYMSDGRQFTSNDIHVIYSVPDRDYVRADELFRCYQRGEKLTFLSEKGRPTDVRLAAVRDAVVKVYNLHVDGISNGESFRSNGVGHNYFVDGILVHNLQSVEHK